MAWKKAGNACVADIQALRYSKSDSIQYKLNFDEDWVPLPSRQLNIVGCVRKIYEGAVPITADKYNQLQSLKCVIHEDYYPFYDYF